MTADDARKELDVLTPRQLELLVYRCKGLTGAQIAEVMGLSETTVRRYADRATAKLGTNTYAACWLVGKAGLG